MLKIAPHPIKNTIYKCSKYSLVFYISSIYASESNSWYNVDYKSSVYISLPYSKDISKDYLKTRSYRITKTNIRSLRRTIERVIAWFDKSDDRYKDLFFYDEKEELWFNTEYSGLYEATVKGYFDNQLLKFIPAVIEVGNNVKEEGVGIYVNIKENYFSLTYKELITLYDLICNIDLDNLTKTVIEAFRYAIASGKFEDEAAYKARLNNLKMMEDYNS